MKTKIIYFVHGTTTDNAEKLCSGWKEAMLNELGKEQANNLGNVSRERGDSFDIMFTSDLKRAIESSNIAFPKFFACSRPRSFNTASFQPLHNLDALSVVVP